MPTAPTPSIIIDPPLANRIARVEQMRPRELREFKAQLDVEGGPFVDGRDGPGGLDDTSCRGMRAHREVHGFLRTR